MKVRVSDEIFLQAESDEDAEVLEKIIERTKVKGFGREPTTMKAWHVRLYLVPIEKDSDS